MARDRTQRQRSRERQVVSASTLKGSDEQVDIYRTMFRIRLIADRLVRAEISSQDEGQALIEYALIISLIALIAIAALKTTGTSVSGILSRIAGEV